MDRLFEGKAHIGTLGSGATRSGLMGLGNSFAEEQKKKDTRDRANAELLGAALRLSQTKNCPLYIMEAAADVITAFDLDHLLDESTHKDKDNG
ncbi:MAG: hypothetical protein JKY52_09195 [Flavobacteriales bacterium]|nr:hypothetical protein [Flavobacteriales bacterium]